MATTEERVGSLAKQYLDMDRDPDFDRDFSDADVSSMDAVAFAKSLASEFGTEIPAEDFAGFKNLRDLVAYLDANA